MFKNRSKGRTFNQNVRLAGLLSVVAGVVNIVGILWLKTLTTNITGHFSFFSEELFSANYKMASISILFLLSFLTGAFLTNTFMEFSSKGKTYFSYRTPLTIEVILLSLVAFSEVFFESIPLAIPCTLLLAMGLQNALVTKVSRSVVRTTHLTGIFTDLGIELSQLIFHKKKKEQKYLKRAIMLKFVIIFGFFGGGFQERSCIPLSNSELYYSQSEF